MEFLINTVFFALIAAAFFALVSVVHRFFTGEFDDREWRDHYRDRLPSYSKTLLHHNLRHDDILNHGGIDDDDDQLPPRMANLNRPKPSPPMVAAVNAFNSQHDPFRKLAVLFGETDQCLALDFENQVFDAIQQSPDTDRILNLLHSNVDFAEFEELKRLVTLAAFTALAVSVDTGEIKPMPNNLVFESATSVSALDEPTVDLDTLPPVKVHRAGFAHHQPTANS